MNRRDRRAHKKTDVGELTPAAQCEAGHRLLQSGQSLEAQLCCQKLLASDPNHAGALHLMGLIAFRAGQYDHALEWTARAIAQEPKPDYIASLATTLLKQGRREEALKAFDKAVQLKPDDADLWRQIGDVLLELQRYDHALLSFQHVLKLNPRHQDAAYKSGVLLNDVCSVEEAVACLDVCDDVLPDDAATLQARARALLGLKKYEPSLADSLRANTLAPGDADTLNNIGTSLQSLGRAEEALVWFDSALERLPDSIEILNNKASVLGQLQRFDEALALLDHIRACHPANAMTDWHLALLKMLLGDFEAGWAGREARWTIPDPAPYPKFSQPMWLREGSIQGKTILIHVDEGLGDSIQFVRYAPMVAGRGARVILVVERPLVPLLSGLSGVSQCLAFGEPLPAFDMHCPIGTLPMVFGTRLDNIPAETSYLPSPDEARVKAWNERLGAHDRLRIGLVWSGNRNHRNDHNRSTSLRALSHLLDIDATFVSLQKDPRPDDKAELDTTDIIDWTAEFKDLAHTAALGKCLDLVGPAATRVAP